MFKGGILHCALTTDGLMTADCVPPALPLDGVSTPGEVGTGKELDPCPCKIFQDSEQSATLKKMQERMHVNTGK